MKFQHCLPLMMILFALAGCSKLDSDDQNSADKKDDHLVAGVTLDADAQKKIGVEVSHPASGEWRPGVQANGRVLDPILLADSLADLHRVQLASNLARQEFERAKQLKEQNNVSTRTYQEAEGTYLQSATDVSASQRKIESTWGKKIADLAGAADSAVPDDQNGQFFLQQLTNAVALVRVDLPIGTRFNNPEGTVRIRSLVENSGKLTGTNFDQLPVIDPQTQQQGILVAVSQPATNRLIPGETVTAELEGSESVSGVTVPASAVLCYEGKSWVYIQTETNQFLRIEVPMDRERENSYFVDNQLSITNRIIITGAQAVLSVELGGGFTTGERD